MTFKRVRNLSIIIASGFLTGCVSVKIPNFDFIKFTEFKQDAENVGDYPKVEDAQNAPENLRTDEQWDGAANRIMSKRDALKVPNSGDDKTGADIEKELEKVGAQVDAYKDDDPQ